MLCRQFVSIPIGTIYEFLVANLFLFCCERDFTISLFDDNQANVSEAFNTTSYYLDSLINVVNPFFEGMVNQFIHLNSG